MAYKYIKFFRGALGLNTRAGPARLITDRETGLCELAQAVNVDVDAFRRISRRPGAKATACDVPAHSIYSILDTTLFVSDYQLCKLEDDYSYTVLATLDSDARMSFLYLNDLIYFSNGVDKGIYSITENDIYEWEAGEYFGPRTDREFLSPPPGEILEFYHGRIHIAEGSVLWFTEPFGYNWVDYSENYYVLPSRITMLRAIDDGLYIGTTTGVHFLRGDASGLLQVSAGHVVRGTDVLCHKEDIQTDLVEGIRHSGPCVICASSEGILFLGRDGYVKNLTGKRIEYPVQSQGAAYVYEGKYVVIME
jgi:hypothetical protein